MLHFPFNFKMWNKMLYDLVESIVGKAGVVIVDILKDKKDVNEFKIAEKLKLTINQVRNLLYKLDAHDVVSFIRKKDKRKGWYIYYWSLDTLKSLKLLARIKEKNIQQLNHVLASHENKRFFRCKGCDVELTEENALTHNFICSECGCLFELSDNKSKILEIKKSMAKEKKELELIKGEIATRSVEDGKKMARKEERIKRKADKKKHNKPLKKSADKNKGKAGKKQHDKSFNKPNF